MADLTFDAVIVGGGNKGLMLAMYLMKYAGMSVGIFERRHEIGGMPGHRRDFGSWVPGEYPCQHHPPHVLHAPLA